MKVEYRLGRPRRDLHDLSIGPFGKCNIYFEEIWQAPLRSHDLPQFKLRVLSNFWWLVDMLLRHKNRKNKVLSNAIPKLKSRRLYRLQVMIRHEAASQHSNATQHASGEQALVIKH